MPGGAGQRAATLVTAWRSLPGFEGRASVRTWLYRIATTRCLNMRRSAGRRPAVTLNAPGVRPPEPTRLGEAVWLEPYPDLLLEEVPDRAAGPEARYEVWESVSLAFVTGLQVLPPRQRAVLILRDVLDFPAGERSPASRTPSCPPSACPAPCPADGGLRPVSGCYVGAATAADGPGPAGPGGEAARDQPGCGHVRDALHERAATPGPVPARRDRDQMSMSA